MGARAEGFKRVDRLRLRREFRYVAERGRRAGGRGFVVLAASAKERGEQDRIRLGITVSRRVGGAVVRNRVKRRVREWFRRERCRMQVNLDILVVAQRRSATLTQQETRRALEEGAQRAGLLR